MRAQNKTKTEIEFLEILYQLNINDILGTSKCFTYTNEINANNLVMSVLYSHWNSET